MDKKLIALQRRIYRWVTEEAAAFDEAAEGEESYVLGEDPKLYFFPVGELYDLSFFGEGFDDYPELPGVEIEEDAPQAAYCAFLDLICGRKEAERVYALTFDGPDEGANGMKLWDLSRVIRSGAVFSKLKHLRFRLRGAEAHNICVLTAEGEDEYRANGTMGALLRQMPALESLTIPSAPDRSFFEGGRHPLRRLTLQSGLDSGDFIRNLATCDRFPELEELDFTDLLRREEVDEACEAVTFEACRMLVEARRTLPALREITLRRTALDRAEREALRRLRPEVRVRFDGTTDEEGGLGE